MKINIENFLLVLFLIVLVFSNIYFVTPNSDTYLHYLVSKMIMKNPSILWEPHETEFLGGGQLLDINIYTSVTPLPNILYAFLFLIGIGPKIIDIISIIGIAYFLFKLDKRAIPFLFLSFLFIRISIFGGHDLLLLFLMLGIIYFFERKPKIAAIFAGFCPLVKTTGFIILGAFILSLFIFKRKEIFTKNFYKNKFFIAFLISILIIFPWYLRNFIFFDGDILATLTGQSYSRIVEGEEWLKTGIQAIQPERYWWDASGYYPLPIDILFYIGLLFTAINFYRERKFDKELLFIIIFAVFYFSVQALNIQTLMSIRYILPIFPLLALQITKGVSEKYLKYFYVFCLIMLVFFMYNIPKYSFNTLDAQLTPVCNQAKAIVDYEPVYVKFLHNWFLIYKCDFNAVSEEQSIWTVDLEKGEVYKTNRSLS